MKRYTLLFLATFSLFLLPASLLPAFSADESPALTEEQRKALDDIIQLLERLQSQPDAKQSIEAQLQKAIEDARRELAETESRIKDLHEQLEQALKQRSSFEPSNALPLVEQTSPPPAGDAAAIDFEKEIFPIFQASCLGCHGADQQSGQLRLDAKKVVLQGGISGKAVVPGKPEESILLERITGSDGKQVMPVGDDPLPPEQIKKIRLWIAQGAKWDDHVGEQTASVGKHWAYVTPERPELPDVKNEAWVRNPIDRFVLARLEKEGLAPSPETEKTVLLRRAALDLIGIPPEPEVVDTFLADESADAYEKAIDRLLASPRYGERWAMQWLDLARYADSNGYEKDAQRVQWNYRDWVIGAFNRNLPFDEFTIEQLAGDLLPDPSSDQLVATGFHRNTMINEEGGVDQEEYRVAAVLDRTNTTATVYMGTTMECAQCHNHKFDPFSQKEYYQLFAFFNNTPLEVNRRSSFEAISNGPWLKVPTTEQEKEIAKLQPEINALEAVLYADTEHLAKRQKEWEADIQSRLPEWNPLVVMEIKSEKGEEIKITDRGDLVSGKITAASDVYTLKVKPNDAQVTGLRLKTLPPPMPPEIEYKLSLPVVTVAVISGSDKEEAQLMEAKWDLHPQDPQASEAVFFFDQPKSLAQGAALRITVDQRYASGNSLGAFSLAWTSSEKPDQKGMPGNDILALIDKGESGRDSEEAEKLKRYYRSIAPELETVNGRIAELKKQLPKDIPTTLIMREMEEPRETNVFMGGSFLSKGEAVAPSVPAVLPPLPDADKRPDRMTLAKWLVNRKNPLTARVTVNRVWEQYFGTGIVKTTEDFGTQGERPLHPELLDWLAVEFMEDGWDLKRLHKLIVTSAAYRQSSAVTKEKMERDPDNRLLSRGPRFRLPAEMIRDNALAISGLLSDKMGGPSVFPYQPPGIWKMPYSSAKWEVSSGEDRYRRGLYVHWQRTAPYPSFKTFDAPSREVACTRRPRTNTPLQALTILNDPVYFEASQALARRIVTETDKTVEKRIEYGFKLCTARTPGEKETARLKELYEQQLSHYKEHADEAEKVVKEGNNLPAVDISAPELAAWTIVSNVLLNLDETITKG